MAFDFLFSSVFYKQNIKLREFFKRPKKWEGKMERMF